MFEKLTTRLFRPTDIASLIFIRIAFGVLAFIDVLGTWVYYHLEKNAFDPENFQFYYYGFKWVQPWPEPLMSGFFISLLLAAAGVITGYRYRLCSVYFFLGFTYSFLLEKANYLNHGYLFCWLAFIMIFMPADRQLSWRVWKHPEKRLEVMPFWCLLVLRFLIGIVYFFGGLAKINADWLRGIPLVSWMDYKSNTPIIGPILGWSWTPYFMAYAGLVLDLTIVLFLLNRRTRTWAFVLTVCFHILNMLIFNIGIFPYLSIALTAMYFPADFPRKVIHHFAARVRWVNRLIMAWQERMSIDHPSTDIWPFSRRFRKPILVGLSLLMTFHILVPLRHYLFPGPVAWTEEGHRYSWRMMLRSKQGKGYFRIVDQNGATETIRPETYLSSRQERKLYTHPDMILEFAHFLRDKYAKDGQEVAIFAEIEVRLNDYPYQKYIDPEVDLAKEEWHFFLHSDWIMPLSKEPLPTLEN